ncbi:glycosyl transferase [Synergistales bacterium]|nr:glycosyl transferase [Synergistales bacterium]
MNNSNIKNPAPIAFFVYKRPDHTKRTLEALAANDLAADSDLFIFSDGPKDDGAYAGVRQVRELIRTAKDFRSVTITEHETNQGLSKSLIAGITELCDRFGRVIVVEDDILTSSNFLRFMNEGLDKYKNNNEVFSICGFWPSKYRQGDDKAFFIKTQSCWGWATWKRAWDFYDYHAPGWEKLLKDKRIAWDFDLRGRYNFTSMLLRQVKYDIETWDIQWYWAIFARNGLNLFPPYSLTTNIGFDDLSTHKSAGSAWIIQNIDLSIGNIPIVMPDHCDADKEKHENHAEFIYIGLHDRYKSRWSIKSLFWFLYRPLRFIEMVLPFGIRLGVWKR